MSPEICPNCGVEVPRNAKACPECGSDEETGWSEEADAADPGLPDESFNYEKFVRKEFGGHKTGLQDVAWHWWVAAAIVFLLLTLALMR